MTIDQILKNFQQFDNWERVEPYVFVNGNVMIKQWFGTYTVYSYLYIAGESISLSKEQEKKINSLIKSVEDRIKQEGEEKKIKWLLAKVKLY